MKKKKTKSSRHHSRRRRLDRACYSSVIFVQTSYRWRHISVRPREKSSFRFRPGAAEFRVSPAARQLTYGARGINPHVRARPPGGQCSCRTPNPSHGSRRGQVGPGRTFETPTDLCGVRCSVRTRLDEVSRVMFWSRTGDSVVGAHAAWRRTRAVTTDFDLRVNTRRRTLKNNDGDRKRKLSQAVTTLFGRDGAESVR